MFENATVGAEAFDSALDPSVEAGNASPGSACSLVVFQLGAHHAAFPLEDIERVAPMAELAVPPGMPSMLAGILNLAGAAVPVLRLDRLLQLPETRLSLYSVLIVLKHASEGRVAILADRIDRIVTVPESALLPVDARNCFNACAGATVALADTNVSILVPSKILLEKERKVLVEFQRVAQQRLREAGVTEE